MSPRRPSLQKLLLPLAALIVVVVCWQLAVRLLELPAILLPGPDRVLQAVVKNAWRLASATGVTATAALGGLVLSIFAGTLVSMVFSQAAWVRTSFFPYAIFLQTVPIIAIAPVIVIWMGEGLGAVVTISLVISVFPIITNGTAGMVSVSAGLQELFRLNHANRWQRLMKLQLPAALPNLVTGTKIASGNAVLGAIVGEYFAGAASHRPGLGYLIFSAKDQFSMDFLFAAILASTGLGIVLFALVSLIGDRGLLYWCEPRVGAMR